MTQTYSEVNSTIGSAITKTYKDDGPMVSIVVCHHTGDFIYKFADSVRQSVGTSFEGIIVTSDKTLANSKVQDFSVHFHDGMPAAKRNYGTSIAKSKYVAFFDDDVEIEKDCLYELYKSITNTGAGIVYGKLYKADERERLDEAGGYLTWNGLIWSRAEQNKRDNGGFGETCTIFSGKSASCICEKELIQSIGGFDESFGILGEESDLSWRVWLAGRTVFFEPKAKGIHYFNTKFKPVSKYYTNDRVYFNGCRNYITMHLKNLGKEHLWIALLNGVIWIIVGLAMIGTLRVRQGVGILRGIKYVMKNWKDIMRRRKEIQSSRVKTDRELWPDIYRKVKLSYYVQRFFKYISSGLHG